MADVKITALPAATAASTDDLLVIVDDPGGSAATKKITVGNLFAFTEGTPSGAINGTNAAFTVTAPVFGLFILIMNGVVQTPGGVDYTRSGGNVTFVTAPPSGSTLRYWSL